MQKIKVLIFPSYGNLGASSRLRFYQYVPYLRQHGFDIKVASLFNNAYLSKLYQTNSRSLKDIISSYFKRFLRLRAYAEVDIVYIERELFPWVPFLFESFLLPHKIPFIVEYDDAWFHRYDAHSNKLIRFLLGHKIAKVMEHAAVVIVGNQYLADYAFSAGARRVEIVPTVVDLDRYPLQDNQCSKLFNIGWIGSPSTSKYLSLIQPVLCRFFQKAHAKFTVIGAAPNFVLDNIDITKIAWHLDSEVKELSKFDVGIMPLFSDKFSLGKCGYKLIQYMACQKPVIASPIGVNIELVEPNVNGYLANSEQEWFSYFMQLYKSQALRNTLGIAGRKKVEGKYCLQVTAPKVRAILASLV